MPLPQWHASLRPRRGGRTTSLTLFEVSWFRVRPIPRASRVAGRSFLPGLLLLGLSTPEHQQLSVGGEDLGNGVLELASLLDQWANLLHPFLRDMFDALLAVNHERQRPRRMPLSIGAPAGGFSAAFVSQGERAGQSVGRNFAATEQGILALTQAGSGIAFGVVPIHLTVLLRKDAYMSRSFSGWGNLRTAPARTSSIPTWHYRCGPEVLACSSKSPVFAIPPSALLRSGIMTGVNKGACRNFIAVVVALLYLSLLSPALSSPQTATAPARSILPGPKPPDVSLAWKQLVGIYGDGKTSTILLERDSKLLWKLPAKTPWNRTGKLEWDVRVKADGNLDAGPQSAMVSMLLVPMRDGAGNVTQIDSGPLVLKRTDAGADPAHFFHVTPSKPVPELRAESLHVAPPEEPGPFRKPDLVELTALDPGFHLDIRYAQSNNFLSTPVYTQARAFMQRPAAEALLRVLHKLQPHS